MMKIGLVQISSELGKIKYNIGHHLDLIETAMKLKPDLLFFPELSLTGYTTTKGSELAMDLNDARLSPFQTISDSAKCTIGIGVPLKSESGVSISMVLFTPQQKRQAYFKQFLHPDEEPYFVSGINSNSNLRLHTKKIALAICHEISVAAHLNKALSFNPDVYVASVAKTEQGITSAHHQLKYLAKDQSLISLLSNSVGICEGFTAAGQSAIWNHEGERIAQMNTHTEGGMIYDVRNSSVDMF